MEYQMEMRMGCSTRRYQWLVIIANSGKQPASKRPRKKRQAIIDLKSWHRQVNVSAIPHPRINEGIRIRCGTLTMSQAENGCHPNCAIGAMDPRREY